MKKKIVDFKNINKILESYADELEELKQEKEERANLEELQESRRLRAEAAYEGQKDVAYKNKIVPSVFAEAVYSLDGKPFRLDARDYLHLIYNSDIKEGLLKCGRQVEKSSTASVLIANWTLLTPFFRSLYFAPLNEQVKVFSEDRLGRLFKYSQQDVIGREFIDKHDKQNVFNKSFLNGALIYLRHCYGLGDNIRGITVNGIFGDEIQDILVDALPVIEECQSHASDVGPGIKMKWLMGTPKTHSNTIEYLWQQSNQCEWVVRCPHCGTHQILGLNNLAGEKCICRKCALELTKYDIAKCGRWIKMNEDSKAWGFRINQLMCPSMPFGEISDKIERYDDDKINNEILGLSYENADQPFSPLLMNELFRNDYSIYENGIGPGEFTAIKTYMGIDWGTGQKSFTCVQIGIWNVYGKFQILYAKKYEKGEEIKREYQLNDIRRLMYIFRISYCIADYGHGFQSNEELKKEYGARFDCMYYSAGLSKDYIYNMEKMMWVVNRTKIIHEYEIACRSYNIIFPGKSRALLSHIEEHHIVEQVEYRTAKARPGANVFVTRSEEMYYTHPADKPDDALHASIYCYWASILKSSGMMNMNSIEFSSVYGR
jgi:hypothetical protein